jgi:rfaE bifunctional protein nucleotidyltransferase chain/domain
VTTTVQNKILSVEALAEKAEEFKSEDKSVVLCHGTFDLMHMGHIRYLQEARKQGDYLFVTITGDQFVNKGPGRPVFPEDLRAETLAALVYVDYVGVNFAVTAQNVIEQVKPNIYAKGQEYKNAENDVTGNIIAEKNAVEANGGTMYFTDDIVFSSTKLLNEHFGVFPEETKEYLEEFRKKYKQEDLINFIHGLRKLRVLVVGDAIIDEYHYTVPMGQSAKGMHLAVRYQNEELFAGGALAVANHLSGFVDNLTIATGLGKKNSYEGFINSKLNPNIEKKFFYIEDAPTVVKRRFVDIEMNKLFEVYYYNDHPNPEPLDLEACPWLKSELKNYDLVIVPDFGNGFITKNMINALCEGSNFLAVNTQLNSGNRGYHVINKYPRADFVSLNEGEVRLAAHNRHDPIEKVAKIVGQNIGAKNIAITQGTEGAFLLNFSKDKRLNVPALSTKVVDRVGAGDTFLAISSLCLGGKLPPDISIFLGSAAAAMDVQIVCNRDSIEPVGLIKYIGTLLK